MLLACGAGDNHSTAECAFRFIRSVLGRNGHAIAKFTQSKFCPFEDILIQTWTSLTSSMAETYDLRDENMPLFFHPSPQDDQCAIHVPLMGASWQVWSRGSL